MLPNINKFHNKILDFFRKLHEDALINCLSYCDARLESYYFFKEKHPTELIPVLLLQRIAELSPPSHILYTLVCMMVRLKKLQGRYSTRVRLGNQEHTGLSRSFVSYDMSWRQTVQMISILKNNSGAKMQLEISWSESSHLHLWRPFIPELY